MPAPSLHDLVHNLRAVLLLQIGYKDSGTFTRQQQGRGPANTIGRACDQRNLACDTSHNRSLLSFACFYVMPAKNGLGLCPAHTTPALSLCRA